MSISTSLPELEPAPQPVYPKRRPARRRRRFGGRGWIAVGLTAIVLLVGIGAFLAYQNTLPTTVAANFKDGQKDVPTDSRFSLTFTRPVALTAVQNAFSISPATDGSIDAVSGQTQFAWTPHKPLSELTTYTVTMSSLNDLSHHKVSGGQWSFTTIIVPRVIDVVETPNIAIRDGDELDPNATLKLSFNDSMEPSTVNVSIGSQPATLKWATDDRSATLALAGMPSGPLTVSIAPGGHDQTGHLMAGSFTLKSGIYYHDREHTVSLRYPALIQIPNDSFAWDQNGLQAADIVFEYLAEGGITRLTAVFQNAPDLIGPMRSSRFISLKLARHYDGLLFQSGESQATAARERQDPVPQFFDTIGYQFRTGARIAPDNLMITGASVRAAENNYFSGLATFTIPKSRPTLPAGTGASTISVDEHYSVYKYDSVTGTYTKTELDHMLLDKTLGQPLRIEMLIVLHTSEYLLNVGDGHGAHIHDFDLDSSGRIQVYYKGQGYSGSWSAPNRHGPLVFTLSDGTPLTLPPGLVWIDVTA